MQAQNRTLGVWLVRLMMIGLLIYTSLRTYHLMLSTLPQDGNSQLVAGLTLFAFDVGLLGWTYYYMNGARGATQRAIALSMILVSLLGVVIAFGADTLISSIDQNLLQDQDKGLIGKVAVYGTSAIIALHIVAGIFEWVADPENRRRAVDQTAMDEVIDLAQAKTEQDTPLLAAKVAPLLSDARLKRIEQQFHLALKDEKVVPAGEVERLAREMARSYQQPPQVVYQQTAPVQGVTGPAQISGPAPIPALPAADAVLTCHNPNCPKPNHQFVGRRGQHYCSDDCKREMKRAKKRAQKGA